MKDIRFYDLDLNLIHILPPHGGGRGYISINASLEFCGAGLVEIVFIDNELFSKITTAPDNLIVTWGNVQGVITSYIQKGSTVRLIGTTLNGLLHRVCIPPQIEKTSTGEAYVRRALGTYTTWLTLDDEIEVGKKKPLISESLRYADDFVREFLSEDNAGYRVYADLNEKKFRFCVIGSTETNLILSENNRTAYEVETMYNNKEAAYSGWYEDEADGEWTKITLDEEKTGIYEVETILEAKKFTEARKELRSKKAESQISAKTKNIVYERDYHLGDIVRVQKDNRTVSKLISGVDLWQESNSDGEEPKMTDYIKEAE